MHAGNRPETRLCVLFHRPDAIVIHNIESHYGPTLTAKVARDLVVFLRRHGGHDQTSIHLSFREHLHPGVHRIQDWLSTHFAEPVPLARLAKLANMSSRNLVRVFKTAT